MAIKNLQELAKFVEGGADVLQKAMESKEEVELPLIAGSFVSNEQLDALKSTVREEGKKEWHTIGYDFAMKDLKRDLGLEIEGKDRKVIIDAAKAKIIADAKIEPDKKVKDLSESLTKLQETYQSDLSAKTKEIEGYQNQLKSFKINSDLAAHIPQGLNGIRPQHFATIAKTEYGFDYDETGTLVVMQNGKVLKDKLEKPVPPSEVLTDFAKRNNWIGTPGRGGSDDPGTPTSEFKSEADVYKFLETNKINPMSAEGQKLLTDFRNSKT